MIVNAKTLPTNIALFFCTLTLAVLGAVFLAQGAPAQCSDDTITIKPEDTKESPIRFFLDSRRSIESLVSIDLADMTNLKPSQRLPYTFVVDNLYKQREVLRLVQTDPNISWHFGPYSFRFVMGIPSSLRTVDYVYALPYTGIEAHIGQSYMGKFSHKAGSEEQYAVDFDMPEGTPIRAARPGKVIAYRDDSSSGGNSADFARCCNYIHIKHDDGTYAAYVHLRHQGVCVKLGQVVDRGTVIGYSGSTGWASCPHLHFMVYRVLNPPKMETVPFRMQTSEGILDQLSEGHEY